MQLAAVSSLVHPFWSVWEVLLLLHRVLSLKCPVKAKSPIHVKVTWAGHKLLWFSNFVDSIDANYPSSWLVWIHFLSHDCKARCLTHVTTSDCFGHKSKQKSNMPKTQGQGWFRGILQISELQVKDDITRILKNVRLGFIVVITPRSPSHKRSNHQIQFVVPEDDSCPKPWYSNI